MIMAAVTSSVVVRLLALSMVLGLSACALPQPVPPIEVLRAHYAAAVQAAQTATPDDIVRDLVAITPANDALIWRDHHQKVLVTTWTNDPRYADRAGKDMVLPDMVWVTVVPQVQERCRGQADMTQTVLRLEQLLGLPPQSGYDRFVEFWVDPRDLFRPTPDPEISDHEAELDFPISTRYVTVSEAHKQWFNALRASSYGKNGYPWTRLGYTYDWGNPETKVGLSEFVIRADAVVQVHRVADTQAYCRAGGREWMDADGSFRNVPTSRAGPREAPF